MIYVEKYKLPKILKVFQKYIINIKIPSVSQMLYLLLDIFPIKVTLYTKKILNLLREINLYRIFLNKLMRDLKPPMIKPSLKY